MPSHVWRAFYAGTDRVGGLMKHAYFRGDSITQCRLSSNITQVCITKGVLTGQTNNLSNQPAWILCRFDCLIG